MIDNPYIPERDLFRLIKYGTYDIVELESMMPNTVPENELTPEEHKLVDEFYKENMFMFDDEPDNNN